MWATSSPHPYFKDDWQTGMNIITRVMGLIIAAVAVEYVYRGLIELFPKLT